MTETVTVATIVAAIGDIFTEAISWVTAVGTAITGNPLLLFFVLLSCVGLGVGLFKRLINIR